MAGRTALVHHSSSIRQDLVLGLQSRLESVPQGSHSSILQIEDRKAVAARPREYNEPFGLAASKGSVPMKSTRRTSVWPNLALGLVAIAAVLLAFYQTRYGPGTSGDSTSYLMGARNLLLGNGYGRFSGGYEVKPITGFPPGYSAMIAIIGLSGIGGLTSAQLINCLLFGINVLLIGYLVRTYTESPWLSATAGALFVVQETQLELHSWVMSEPLYLGLTLAGMVAILRYLERGRFGWLLAAGFLAAGSTLVRYVGPALTGAGAVIFLLLGTSSLRRRIVDATAFGAVSVIPVILWLQRNSSVAGTTINRELGYHPMEPGLVRLFLAEFSSWFVPHEVPLPTGVRAALSVLIAAGLVGGFFWLKLQVRKSASRVGMPGPAKAWASVIPWLLALYAAANLSIIFINSTFLDASTTAAAPPRYLAPVFGTLLPLAIMAGNTLAKSIGKGMWGSRVASTYAFLIFGLYLLGSLDVIRYPLSHLGYTGRRVLWASTVERLEEIPEDIAIVTNNPEMAYILAGRPAYVRPISFDQYRDAPREDYQEQFEDLKRQLSNGGVFVVFDGLEEDDLAMVERLHLEEDGSTENAHFYLVPAFGPASAIQAERSLARSRVKPTFRSGRGS